MCRKDFLLSAVVWLKTVIQRYLRNVFQIYIHRSGFPFVSDKTTRITPWKQGHISEFRLPCTKPNPPQKMECTVEPQQCRNVFFFDVLFVANFVQKITDTLELFFLLFQVSEKPNNLKFQR